VLSVWSQKVVAYLRHPAVETSALVSLLRNAHWHKPLDIDAASQLQQRLLECTTPVPDKAQFPINTPIEPSVSSDSVRLDVEPEVIELLIGQVSEVADENAQALNELIEADEGGETLLTAVMTYTENVQAIADAADMAGLGGLTEVCTFINENMMALGGQPKSVREAAREVLSVWSQKVVAYLRLPAVETSALVSLLRNAHWHKPLDIDAASQLQQRLLECTTPAPDKAQFPINTPIEPSVSSDSVRLDVEPDVIELLIGQVSEVADENAQVLNELMAADEGSEALLSAVMTYTENVQAVADAADMAGLEGLTEVCTFINENMMALGGQPKSAREAARDVLSMWTEKVVAYLRFPAVETSALVSLLRNAHWHKPLDIDAASQLQQRLLKCTTPVPDKAQFPINTPIEPSVSSDSVRLDVEHEVIELLIGQVSEVADENAKVLNELMAADEGSEALLSAAMTYTENVQAVADAADMAGLDGLTEVCTLINDNVMALSGSVQSERETAREVLSVWAQKVVAYLQQPTSASKVLVNLMLLSHWPTPLDSDAASRLLERLLERTTSEKTKAAPVPVKECAKIRATVNESIELAAPEVLELVCSQITDSTEGLSAAFEVCVSMENDNPAFLEAIEDYTNKVQEIWDTAEMAGLGGLQEVCTFVNENLMAFAGLEQTAKMAAQTYFVGWPLSVLEYLHAPQVGAPCLVSFMQETGWPAPLEAKAANNLLTLLTKPSDKESHEAAVSETLTNESAAFDVQDELVAQEEVLAHDLTPLDVSIVGEISLGNPDGLEILIESLESAKEDLATELNKLMMHGPLDAEGSEALENYTEVVQRLYTVFEMLGLEGLQTVCTFVIDNMKALSKAELVIRKRAKKVLETWPDLVLSYVQSPAQSVIKLVNHLRQPMWTQSLTDEKAEALANQLVAGSTAEEEAEEETGHNRQTQARPEDVLLTLPEDVNQELLDAYLQETPQQSGDFSACIQKIIQEPETKEIERAQRIAHTLKGSSNIIGIKGIANIAHHLEDTLEYLAKHQVVPPKELTDTMVEAADCLEIMVDALLGTDEPPQQALAVLQSVLDWANRIDQGKLDVPPPKPAPADENKTASATSQPSTEKKADKKGKSASEVAGAPEQFLRVPTKTIDELMRLVGELSISVGQIQEKLKHVIQSQRTLTEQDLILHKKTFELENLVDVRGITGIETNSRQALQETKDFDPLEFEQYNELHSVAHSFVESIADNRELAISIREDIAELETMFIHQERLNKEFQANIMTTRMVPVNTIISKLQRNVRQTCRMTGKKAELEVTGQDILIDSDVLNNLADPLQHLLRNAIDHGLESVDERAILGKPIEGAIKLSFYREGNNIVVSLEDDGQGLNYTNIRFTAIQRGLITENQELTEKELARLILMSGFSTKSGVTQVSGRGVGMDVVHTNIRQMKGTLDLLSETGKGTTILIKLPMTLVTVHVLLVRVGERQFGIPTNNLEQALAPGMAEFHKVGDEVTLKMGKNFYGLKYLANLLSVPGDREGLEDPEIRPIILVHEETGITAVIVDDLLDTHDLVMKSMGKYVKNIPGVGGASILGDGSLVPLLDLPELLRSPMQAAMGSIMAEATNNDEVLVGAGGNPHIMIVDDSLSVRKSLSLLVEDAGFETLLAKDGLEAIEIMNQTRPNVMLVDMEMPRMNGLELTAHVRANQATQKLPIFMITSRTTEKHREQAATAGVNAYLTKPYQDTQLLELIDKALTGQV
jgi:chemosensory pili system protein ChpA (sensor histidine kinase/response regulator)